VKIFSTASPEVRASRRARELAANGTPADYMTVLADIRARDERDSRRMTAPLIPALDAHVLDTSRMDIDEAVRQAIMVVETIKLR
jgi:cytidylate kinase